jgi:hypothetical protein
MPWFSHELPARHRRLTPACYRQFIIIADLLSIYQATNGLNGLAAINPARQAGIDAREPKRCDGKDTVEGGFCA